MFTHEKEEDYTVRILKDGKTVALVHGSYDEVGEPSSDIFYIEDSNFKKHEVQEYAKTYDLYDLAIENM